MVGMTKKQKEKQMPPVVPGDAEDDGPGWTDWEDSMTEEASIEFHS